jgi:hypothetical protein
LWRYEPSNMIQKKSANRSLTRAAQKCAGQSKQ